MKDPRWDVQPLAQVPDEEAPAFLRSVLAAVPAFITRIDCDDRITFISGAEQSDFLGRNVLDCYPISDQRAAARACFELVRRTGRAASYEAIGGEARAHYVSYVAPILGSADSSLCIVGFDVSEERARQRSLEQTCDRLQVVLEASQFGMWDWDVVTGEIVWDARMRAITGWEEPLDAETFIQKLVHPEDRDKVRLVHETAQTTGQVRDSVCRIIRPDGQVRWTASFGLVKRDEQGNPLRFVGGTEDITAQHETEQRLRQMQKQDAIGKLTAGIAHNFNNMLTVLLPALEAIEEEVPESQRGLVQDCLATTERAAEMVRQLMTFAGQKKAGEKRACDLARLIDQSVEMCRRTFGRQIVIPKLTTEPVIAWADENALQQVLMNLLLNARNALVEAEIRKPRISVTLTQAEYEDQAAARISIEDNGPGIAPELRERIFEPFFSTRDEGTGLGLSTSYAILREHGGTVECQPAPQGGTIFDIWLPLTDRGAEPHGQRPS